LGVIWVAKNVCQGYSCVTGFKKTCGVFMTLKEVMESARALTVREKAFMAHCLISSLETKHDEDVDNAWKELADRRCDELLSGKISGISWEEMKKQIRP
jgi:putative addiction module component (TIGR02574 family)